MAPRVTRNATRLSAAANAPAAPKAEPAQRTKKRVIGKEDTEEQEEAANGVTTTTKIEDKEVVVRAKAANSETLGRNAKRRRVSEQRVVEEDNEEEEEEREEEVEKVTVRKTKAARKVKAKAGAEAEMVPLAARTKGLRMFVGAHVSAAQGVHNAITNSAHIGGNAFALFLKSQRKWDNPPLQDEHRDKFHKLCAEHSYDPKHILPHGSYLVNLAQEDPAKAKQAYTSFLDDLKRCEALGIQLYNFHPGATIQSTLDSSLSRIATALTNALSATRTVVPVLETMCGQGTTIGGSLSHFRTLLSLIPSSHHSRIGICVDTCHSFAAGYDLVTPSGWNAFMSEFDEQIGLKHLRAMHLNDSKAPGGSKRDLHANIGTGFLGLRAFHNVMNDRRLEGIPMVLETPIDRLVPTTSSRGNGEVDDDDGSSANEEEEETSRKKKPAKAKKKPAVATKKKKPATVEDKSIWAREIKLLESLIGMDIESEEFLRLEKELADQGCAEREKQLALYEKKVKEKEKKEAKQRDLRDMFGAAGAGAGAGAKGSKGAGGKKAVGKRKKKADESGSDEEGSE
ncbi:hypothetical protein AJ80_04103 [Polytolypa hystricis UAMH7299]|uniref:Apurinic-apyrimidinic endonuclease 1 n=1 Tax=Polytolypa hystricis (strain UAMH7299) TaxID=1447883 RepID=A0A2B7YEA2_POLH7|nr:hypothetical protein AJ80_04103 [Polytolypa hystricis UAMH7299]